MNIFTVFLLILLHLYPKMRFSHCTDLILNKKKKVKFGILFLAVSQKEVSVYQFYQQNNFWKLYCKLPIWKLFFFTQRWVFQKCLTNQKGWSRKFSNLTINGPKSVCCSLSTKTIWFLSIFTETNGTSPRYHFPISLYISDLPAR